MIIDCYDLLSAFAQTEEGSIKLVDYGTVTALSEVITKHLPGRSLSDHSRIESLWKHMKDNLLWKN